MIQIQNSIFLFAGIALLGGGAHFLVNGAKALSLKMGIRPLIISLTVVAFGTSAPELLVSLISAIKEAKSMAVGNIIGSNIANIALVMATAALVRPISCDRDNLKLHFPIMLLISVLFYLFSLDKMFSRLEGFIFLTMFALYVILCIKTARNKESETFVSPGISRLYYLFITCIGCTGVVIGANLLVTGGIYWAKILGVSDIVIGLTIFAIGTSLPELATSVTAMVKNESDISLGNVIGSNIQNIALVIAIVACISPLSIPEISLRIDFPVMLIFSCIFYGFFLLFRTLSRAGGAMLLLLYIIYVFHLYIRN